jgi:AcrR family transcriptional regulator
MSRWEPNARERLTGAAMDLFRERGFDQTTVAEIADRAGLTERTFFRYFADKREVLFAGQERLLEIYTATIDAAPGTATPMELVEAALLAGTPVFDQRRDLSRQRHAVISAHPELQERELLKRASMAAAVAAALRQRGVPEPTASLAAEAGAITFKTAYSRWVTNPGPPDLPQLIRETIGQFHALAAPAPASAAGHR